MGKTRDLFEKIRDVKGTFHAKMGTKKNDTNGLIYKTENKLMVIRAMGKSEGRYMRTWD